MIYNMFVTGVYYLMVSEGRKAYLLFSNIKEEVGAYEDPNKGKPNPLKASQLKAAASSSSSKSVTHEPEEKDNSLEAVRYFKVSFLSLFV